MSSSDPSRVFINCPFDPTYWPLLEVIVFTVIACGFRPGTALDEDDGAEVRLDKIMRKIEGARYGIHDLSRVELDPTNHLPRFNMPFELGLDLACKRFGGDRKKRLLILERSRYTTQKCLSDVAGQDPKEHDDDPEKLLKVVRNWLRTSSGRSSILGYQSIQQEFEIFSAALPGLCERAGLDRNSVPFVDYVAFVQTWLLEANTRRAED